MFYNTTHKRVQYCDGTNWVNMGVSSLGSSDNLGNHTATQALAMGGFNITGAGAITGTSFTGVGTALTALNASNLGSGTVPTARLGTGTADSTTYLRGDGAWAAAGSAPTCTRRTASNTGVTQQTASCLAGEIVTGGGGECAAITQGRSSYPNAALTAWTHLCAGGANSVTAYAICCDF